MNGSFKVGNLFGIPFYINSSWFLVLALVTFSYGSQLATQFQMGGIVPWLLGLFAALLLFSSVLAHELGHSFVAIKQGIEVKSITLFLFGGLASLEKESKTPGEAFWVAIAGPLVSFILFGIFTAIGAFTNISGAAAAVVGLLAYINFIIGTFNLIPGLPLDGGNILKSAVWKITGNPYKGVMFAGRVGQIFGWIAIISGVLPILFYGSFDNIWNLLIGAFLLQNAGMAAQSANVQNELSKFTAADAVTPDSPIISAEMDLREFANEYVIGKAPWRQFLVIDESGKLIGKLLVDDLKQIPTHEWPTTPVKTLMKSPDFRFVKSTQTLLEVVTKLEEYKVSELPVIDENGVVLGILEKSGIKTMLQQQQQAQMKTA
jgi:Zn-dependent protease/CBS domain-containing protein